MMKMMWMMLMSVTLTACDYIEQKEFRGERDNRLYQAAMADYSAGRIEQAIATFSTIIKDNPANASARFQFACLMQDVKHRYLDAYCSYREYLMQHPDSDKADVASSRMVMCEREIAKELADKYEISGGKGMSADVEMLEKELQKNRELVAKLTAELQEAKVKFEKSEQERIRLAAMIGQENVDSELKMGVVKDFKALLDSEEDEVSLVPAMVEDIDADLVDRPFKKSQKTSAAKAGKSDVEEKTQVEADHEQRPKTYTVQFGDTLTKIAIRFYGNKNAWRMIQESNKAIISTDGRVRAGETIVLP